MNIKGYVLDLLERSGVYEEGKYLGYKLDLVEEGTEVILKIQELDSEITITEEVVSLLEDNSLNLFNYLLYDRNNDNGVLYNVKNRLKLVLEKRYKDYKNLQIKTCSVKKSLVSVNITKDDGELVTIIITGISNSGLGTLDHRIDLEK